MKTRSSAAPSSERDQRDYAPRLLEVAANHTKRVVDLVGRLQAPTALASFEAVVKQPDEFVTGLAEFIGLQPTGELVQSVGKQAIQGGKGYLHF